MNELRLLIRSILREEVIDARDKFAERQRNTLVSRIEKFKKDAKSPETRKRIQDAEREDDELERLTGCRFGDALSCAGFDCKHAPFKPYDGAIVNAAYRFPKKPDPSK